MNMSEFSKGIALLKSVYTEEKFLPDKQSISVWFELLKDMSADDFLNSCKAYMLTEKFPPKPSELRKKMSQLEEINQMSEQECWAIVSKAVRDSAYHAKERFDNFPEEVKKAVGSADVLRAWGMDKNYNELVAQSQFLQCLAEVRKRKREVESLPEETKLLIQSKYQKLIGG